MGRTQTLRLHSTSGLEGQDEATFRPSVLAGSKAAPMSAVRGEWEMPRSIQVEQLDGDVR